jgi:hypothetical protein
MLLLVILSGDINGVALAVRWVKDSETERRDYRSRAFYYFVVFMSYILTNVKAFILNMQIFIQKIMQKFGRVLERAIVVVSRRIYKPL